MIKKIMKTALPALSMLLMAGCMSYDQVSSYPETDNVTTYQNKAFFEPNGEFQNLTENPPVTYYIRPEVPILSDVESQREENYAKAGDLTAKISASLDNYGYESTSDNTTADVYVVCSITKNFYVSYYYPDWYYWYYDQYYYWDYWPYPYWAPAVVSISGMSALNIDMMEGASLRAYKTWYDEENQAYKEQWVIDHPGSTIDQAPNYKPKASDVPAANKPVVMWQTIVEGRLGDSPAGQLTRWENGIGQAYAQSAYLKIPMPAAQ